VSLSQGAKEVSALLDMNPLFGEIPLFLKWRLIPLGEITKNIDRRTTHF